MTDERAPLKNEWIKNFDTDITAVFVTSEASLQCASLAKVRDGLHSMWKYGIQIGDGG